MGLGSLIAKTYSMAPKEQHQAQAQRQAAQAAQTGPPPIGEPETGLQQMDDITRSYYKGWGELEDFATNMWTNFGIDVPKPDFRNPEAMEAHEIYRKALSELRYQGDSLKTGQKMLEMGYQASLRDRNVQRMEDPNTNIASSDTYQNMGMTDQEKADEIMGRQEASQDFQAEQAGKREQDVRLRQQRGFKHDRDIAALRADLDKNKYDHRYGGMIEQRYKDILDIANGNLGLFTTIINDAGDQIYTNPMYAKGSGVIYLTERNGDIRKLDPRSKNFARDVNEVLDRSGDRVKWEDIASFLIKADLGEDFEGTPEYKAKLDEYLGDRKKINPDSNEHVSNAIKQGRLVLVPGQFDTDGNKIVEGDRITDISTSRTGNTVNIDYVANDGEVYTIKYKVGTPKGKELYQEFIALNAEELGFIEKEEEEEVVQEEVENLNLTEDEKARLDSLQSRYNF
jgi:hypothetical protein